jgi:hypothetical protein
MKDIKHKTIILFLLVLVAIAITSFNACSAVGTGAGSHHEKRTISTH